MSDIEIMKLPVSDWRLFKEIRLRALKEEPQAFGKSYAEELETTDERWQHVLSEAGEGTSRWRLFAKEGSKVIGTIGAYREEGQKCKHITTIVGVYVVPEARGKGVATKMLQEIIREIEQNQDIVKITLTVNTRQQAALKVYESQGFKKIATLEKELNIDGHFEDEYLMTKFIR